MKKSFLKEIDQMLTFGSKDDIRLALNLLYNNRNDLRTISKTNAKRLYLDAFAVCYKLTNDIDELNKLMIDVSYNDTDSENLYILLKALKEKEYI
jgi:hypothetical protein